MQHWAVILCVSFGVALANGVRNAPSSEHAHMDLDHLHHAHTHEHGGEVHTHWHSHAGHEEHSKSDQDGDHHDEFGGHDHGDVPFFPPPVHTVQGRAPIGKVLMLCNFGVSFQIEPPPLVPPKPPPRLTLDEDNLLQLRTVILLT